MTMEYDNDDTWRRSSLPKQRHRSCHPIPKKSTTTAVVVLGLAVLSCLLGYCVLSESLPYESKTLRLVVVLFRHGAKAPESTYNSDPFKKYQWPEGPGGLTNIGKIQLYELGRKFRDYYTNFIPEDYFSKDAYFRSSDKDRCLMSAYTFLAGLYPPSERQMWNQEINWQPIPVRSLPKELDNIVAATKPCIAWKKMYNEILAETDKDPKFTEIFDYLTKHANESMRSVLKVDYMYGALLCQQTAGLKLPEWTKNVFPNEMRLPFMTSLALLSYNPQMQRLHTGPLLADIMQHLEDNVQHTNVDRSLFVYSGHDVTVVSLFRALGFQELLEPEFGASITIELHEEEVVKDSFYVKAFYRNNTKVEVPMELKLPFCDEPCEYTKFKQHVDSLIPTNWEEECQNKDQ